MAWNNVYLSTPTPVGNYQGSAATAVFSGISLSAPLQGQIASSSAISGGAITGTTITLNAQGPLTLVSASSTTIVATTVTGSKSVTTNLLTNSSVATGDLILVGPSGLSDDVILTAVASGNTTITFRYSNVSTVSASQVAINCRYQIWRF